MPAAQISWNPPRRSRHWSSRASEKIRARMEVVAGIHTVGISGLRCLVRGDESEEQPVEQARRAVVDRAEPVGIDRSAPGDGAELRQERAPGGDEQRDG